MDTLNNFRLHVNAANPYAGLIEKFLVGEFTPTVQTNRCQVLDLVTEAILASGQVRYGPVPPPETVVAIREVLRHWIEQSRPIPFVIAWGSEKPNGTGIDVAELCALKTLASLQKRVTAHYPPGVQLNIRIEDVSAPHLFYDRMEAARREAALYTRGLVNLIIIMDLPFIKPWPESSMLTETAFNNCADCFLEAMEAHVIMPSAPVRPYLLEAGWTPITKDTVDHYVQCYGKLHPGDSEAQNYHRLARYFSGSLARKVLKMTGVESCWNGKNLELSFVAAAPGIDPNRFTRRVYYRTMPSRITNNHMPPWRAKGYLKVGQTAAGAALANFRAPQEYNPFEIVLERGGLKQVVQSDYVIV